METGRGRAKGGRARHWGRARSARFARGAVDQYHLVNNFFITTTITPSNIILKTFFFTPPLLSFKYRIIHQLKCRKPRHMKGQWMFECSSIHAGPRRSPFLCFQLASFSFHSFPFLCSPLYFLRIDQGHGILHNYRSQSHDWLMSDRTLTEAWTLRSEIEWVSGRDFLLFSLFLFFFSLSTAPSFLLISPLVSTTTN